MCTFSGTQKGGLFIKNYSRNEIKKLLNSKERLVYVEDDWNRYIIKYNDIPDFIVKYNDEYGQTDLYFYDYNNYNFLVSTFGSFLNKCDPKVRDDIIDRLIKLQQYEIKAKDIKLIDKEDLKDITNGINKDKNIKI